MIHYHGLPITPCPVAVEAVGHGHAFVSFAHPEQLGLAVEVTSSFALDNGAWPAFKSGKPITDWRPFYAWAGECKRIPSCDWAVIPDVINGSEADNDALVAEWPLPKWFGVPVWHLNESFERLERLAAGWPRIAFGSSGEYEVVGTQQWWGRMAKAMRVVCNDDGQPLCKIHGLRMLDTKIFTRLPLASADSTNIARNVGIDSGWKGNYMPPNKPMRAAVMRSRIESHNAPATWAFDVPEFQLADQGDMF